MIFTRPECTSECKWVIWNFFENTFFPVLPMVTPQFLPTVQSSLLVQLMHVGKPTTSKVFIVIWVHLWYFRVHQLKKEISRKYVWVGTSIVNYFCIRAFFLKSEFSKLCLILSNYLYTVWAPSKASLDCL